MLTGDDVDKATKKTGKGLKYMFNFTFTTKYLMERVLKIREQKYGKLESIKAGDIVLRGT